MFVSKIEPQWKKRIVHIPQHFSSLKIPETETLRQDAEWCEVEVKGKVERIRFHDYDQIFSISGLYEELFYTTLKCCSPSRVAHLLHDVMADFGYNMKDLSIVDVGAGNGMVGDEFRSRGANKVVGVDIIDEAREATFRDRPGVYDGYFVEDLTNLPEKTEEKLRQHRFNCLTTVAALGFGDIPPRAMIKALDMIETPGWAAFNIKEDFLHEGDSTGFARLIRCLTRSRILQVQAYRRYRHRLSTSGKPLYYVAMVARKLQDLPDLLFDEYEMDN